MTSTKDLKRRARALGWKPDGAGGWQKQVGEGEDGGKIVGRLSTGQLSAYLDPPPLPAELDPLPGCPAPSGRLPTGESEGASKGAQS